MKKNKFQIYSNYFGNTCVGTYEGRVSRIQAEFQDLGRLESAHNDPIRRVETANLGPIPDMFRKFLRNIFLVNLSEKFHLN